MSGQAIVGPVLADIEAVGLDGDEAVIASAFYSGARLEALSIKAKRLDLMVRLDLDSIEPWVGGLIAPDALLDFVDRHNRSCGEVRLFASDIAHTKVYWGTRGFLVGSANLTVRGLSGIGHELLWRENLSSNRRRMRKALAQYAENMDRVTVEDLRDYVERNRTTATARKKLLDKQKAKRSSREDRLPQKRLVRPERLGSYDGFLAWLSRRRDRAAGVIWDRAHGAGQLSGHIRRNFFGIRQFLIASPKTMKSLVSANPDNYRLHEHRGTQSLLRMFVLNEAADEQELVVDTWRTYLPESAGGKPKSGGGTSGNLKRMLPLIARYLSERLA